MTDGPVEVPAGDPVEPVTEPTETAAPEPTTTESGDNPAWSKFLEVIPTSLHGSVKPVLKEWDQGVNARFQEIHQQYDPYKQFVEQQVSPEDLSMAYNLLQALNTDPRALYDEMGKHYGYVGDSGQGSPIPPATAPQPTVDPNTNPIDFGNPQLNQAWAAQQERLAQQEQLLLTMGQAMVAERQKVEMAQQDQQLETALAAAKEKHGDFDEPYVLSLIAQGFDPDAAVKQYQTAIETALAAKNRPAAPVVLSGAGGAMPTEGVDVTKLSSKQTQELVVQALQRAAGQ